MDCRLDRLFLNDCADYARCMLEHQFEYREVTKFLDQCDKLVETWLKPQKDYIPFKSYTMKLLALSDYIPCTGLESNLNLMDSLFLGMNSVFQNQPATYFDSHLLKGDLLGSHESFTFRLSLGMFKYRDVFIFRQGYATLTKRVLDKLTEMTLGYRCLELFAGRCVISKYLSDKGVDIIPTDNNEYGYDKLYPQYQHMPFEKIDAVEAVEKYTNMDYIIMSWIPYEYDTKPLLDAIMKCSPNAKIIHIGELGGCTADYYFQAHYDILECDDNDDLSVLYRAFGFLHDTCTVGRISDESVSEFC